MRGIATAWAGESAAVVMYFFAKSDSSGIDESCSCDCCPRVILLAVGAVGVLRLAVVDGYWFVIRCRNTCCIRRRC